MLSQLASRDQQIADLRRSLDAHKLYAAERFATSEEVATAFGKVEAAISKLADQIHGLLLLRPDLGRKSERHQSGG